MAEALNDSVADAVRDVVGQVVQQTASWLWRGSVQRLGQFVSLLCQVGQAACAGLGQVWRYRRSGLLTVVGGVATGLTSYLGGPLVSAVLCGLAGAGLTLSALVVLPLARLLLASR